MEGWRDREKRTETKIDEELESNLRIRLDRGNLSKDVRDGVSHRQKERERRGEGERKIEVEREAAGR